MNASLLKKQLTRIVAQNQLLRHPFYQAWSKGTLPLTALALYAKEYGAFIQTLPHGWQTLNDIETAVEEKEHIQLWQSFAQALGTQIAPPTTTEVKTLIATAEELFMQKSTARGALYVFEVQQPETAKSKLTGLRAFYTQVNPKAYPYFEVHSHNEHESVKLLAWMEKSSPANQEEAKLACQKMCLALWDALTGIYANCSAN